MSVIKSCGFWTLSCDFPAVISEVLKKLKPLPILIKNRFDGDDVVLDIAPLYRQLKIILMVTV